MKESWGIQCQNEYKDHHESFHLNYYKLAFLLPLILSHIMELQFNQY